MEGAAAAAATDMRLLRELGDLTLVRRCARVGETPGVREGGEGWTGSLLVLPSDLLTPGEYDGLSARKGRLCGPGRAGCTTAAARDALS